MKKNKRVHVVIFSGKKQSGKDTAASILIKENGYMKVALADLLKQASAGVTNVLFGTKVKKSDFENEAFKQSCLPGHKLTYREFLQYFGTEFVRHYIHEDFWVLAAVDTIVHQCMVQKKTKFVITDARLENEIVAFSAYIKELIPGAVVTSVRVQREPQSWWKKIKDHFTEHSSENGLDFYPDWDYYLYNYFDLNSYKKSIRSFIAYAEECLDHEETDC